MRTLPSISLKRIATPTTRSAELKLLSDACGNEGFFYLVDHGVDDNDIKNSMASARKFFSLPTEFKNRFSHENQTVFPKSARGYSPLLGEVLHPDAGADPKEIFDLGIESDVEGVPFLGRTKLPSEEELPNFAASHLVLQHHIISNVVPVLGSAFAEILNLPKDWIDRSFSEPVILQRIIRYPPLAGSAGKHTDNGLFTVLIQEAIENESLQIFLQDQWEAVPSPPDAFVINLGDMLQMLSNNRFVSTPHQVVHASNYDRISLPFFVYPNIDCEMAVRDQSEPEIVADVMLRNFMSIWESKGGAGRARELR